MWDAGEFFCIENHFSVFQINITNWYNHFQPLSGHFEKWVFPDQILTSILHCVIKSICRLQTKMEQMVDTFQPDQSDDFQDFLLVVKGVLIKGKGRLPEKNVCYFKSFINGRWPPPLVFIKLCCKKLRYFFRETSRTLNYIFWETGRGAMAVHKIYKKKQTFLRYQWSCLDA